MSERQAVLLIHGIGEQRPMATLRGFVDALWRADTEVHHQYAPATVWSKPDAVSENFELRRLTTATNRGGLRTDFFEYYWAHQMWGTRLTHVFAWMRTLLLRSPASVPAQLRPVYWVLIAALLITAVLAGLSVYYGTAASADSGLAALVSAALAVVVLPSVSQALRWLVGDAARYLHPAPSNIQRRAEIRHAGVALLQALHQRGYDRIVVVGHSLGSVIGYDILTHAWAGMHASVEPKADTPFPDPTALETMARDESADVDNVQTEQRRYLESLRNSGHPWRVTDFVTLGSPLAHADILLAEDRASLKERQADRELPTCLPVLETPASGSPRFTFDRKVEAGNEQTIDYPIPHHAATFGPTRWTNLYFPCRNIVRGDLIAGPLTDVFGKGIRDVPVETDQRCGYLSHTLYWSPSGVDADDEHIGSVRCAVDLADDRSADTGAPS